jgi:hypothetical protein
MIQSSQAKSEPVVQTLTDIIQSTVAQASFSITACFTYWNRFQGKSGADKAYQYALSLSKAMFSHQRTSIIVAICSSGLPTAGYRSEAFNPI